MGTPVHRLVSIDGEPLFWERFSHARHRTLVLDYDGTLAPFRESRMDAAPLEGTIPLLARIRDGGTELFIMSGRPVAELLTLLGDLRVTLVGSHGAELRSLDGSMTVRSPTPVQETHLRSALETARARGYAERLERKPASVALHTRGLDRAAAALIESVVRADWCDGAQVAGLECRAFAGGMEIRLRGVDKGVALADVMREAPEGSFVVYVGDDETDEDAFRTIRGSGVGIRVGPAGVPTLAAGRLLDENAVREFLRSWAESVEQG